MVQTRHSQQLARMSHEQREHPHRLEAASWLLQNCLNSSPVLFRRSLLDSASSSATMTAETLNLISISCMTCGSNNFLPTFHDGGWDLKRASHVTCACHLCASECFFGEVPMLRPTPGSPGSPSSPSILVPRRGILFRGRFCSKRPPSKARPKQRKIIFVRIAKTTDCG